ncbi:MAG: hypothetical protein A2V65_02350 [Deltaproteobacteria bacterium RBG_13_49_15]|nr:MAG: hypothetical protein A2V65_02350 [Deltaproteobacteria bacterium RBG_13_49_15]
MLCKAGYFEMIDYHIHTPLCRHSTGSMDDCVRYAVSTGMTEICFLDHLTIRPGKTAKSMDPTEVSLYFNAVQVLKDRYKNRIRIKGGLEVDFNPEVNGLIEALTNTFSFDVIAASIHFLGELDIVSRSEAWIHAHMDPDLLYSRYLEQLREMLTYDYFDLICHIDLPKKFGKTFSGSFRSEMDDILSVIKKKGIAVEVNTSGYDHPIGEAYPSPDILAVCRKLGISITIGSDAHHPESIGKHFAKALAQIQKIGYKHLTAFSNRNPFKIRIADMVSSTLNSGCPKEI